MVGLSQRLQLQQKQSPQQVLLSTLLQLPLMALEQKIRLELETNPLLELDTDQEMEEAEEMEATLEEEPVPQLEVEEEQEEEEEEQETVPELTEEPPADEVDWEEILNDIDNYQPYIPREKDTEEFERPEVQQETLTDHLLEQLRLSPLNETERLVGEYIIWNLNASGYLTMDVESIAEALGVDPEVVERVLEVIQHFDPPGIAARNLQECLLIQLMEKPNRDELAVEILRNHFDDLVNRRFEKLAKKLGVPVERIGEALEHIRKLNPKPGEGYVSIESQYVIPDLTVTKEDGEFKVTLNDWNIPNLRINQQYRKLLLDKSKSSREAREYIRKRLESARWLINSIHQRRATILRVMEAIVRRQRDFFENGPEYLKPMVLKDIADDIGMDISTVSRVTSGKYVQTDWGIFELKYFFSEGLRSDDGEEVSNKTIKQRIRQIIEEEDKRRPLSDQEIADLLKKEGLNVARRTVAKYREQMNIPVARLRRGL
ncbi:MAG: RNA polymerase factor sigma-54 [candidate division KSB1 bacterium]|nr:RNA polymerase factor sigma-54 [candidate division KSB1 bacterium]